VMTAMKRHSTDTRVEAKRASNWWTNGLLSAMKDQSLVVLKDDLITIIEDKYPKSRHHLLVIPNKNSGMDSVDDLTASDVQLIDHMTLKGKQISQQFDGSVEFRFGFHRIPSLKPLHLHVISQDFDSKYLKTKKHYNSFTTKFFIDSKTVIENLNKYGKVESIGRHDCEELIKQDIVCHFCRQKVANIPKLKIHLLKHFPI